MEGFGKDVIEIACAHPVVSDDAGRAELKRADAGGDVGELLVDALETVDARL